jgi:hypothetical protein
LPGIVVTPSPSNTRALRICGGVVHIPPVGPSGRRSTSVALKASSVPVFCALMTKSPSCAGFSVAGPDLSTVIAGVPGGGVNCPTRPVVLVTPPSLVMNWDTGLPSGSRKFIASV